MSGALLWLAIGGWITAALTAVGVRVLRDFSAHELEELCNRRRREELFGQILDDHEKVALGVESLQVIATVVMIAAAMLRMLLPDAAAGGADWPRHAAAVVLMALLLLAATVWLPWAVVRLWSAPFLLGTWRFWLRTSQLLRPLALGAGLVETLLRRLAGRGSEQPTEEEAFEDEIRSIVTEGLRDGLLEADAREMIEGVIELGDADVADIMTPRSSIDALDVKLNWPEVLRFVIRVARTRIPVYEGNLDNIVGILYVKDLLPELAKDDGNARRSVRELLRKPWFVPKTKMVDDLLQEFLQSRNHMAVAVDEYQAVAGVVTIEDVLEEIVGEIVDEHDKVEEEEIRRIDDRTAEVLGSAHLDEINEQLGLDLPEDDEFDTVAGLVFSRLGHIPRRGEKIEADGACITVLDASRRRIERVQIEMPPRTQNRSA